MVYRFVSIYRNYQDITAKNLSQACLQLLTQKLCQHQAVDKVYRYISGPIDKKESWKLVFENKQAEIPFG